MYPNTIEENSIRKIKKWTILGALGLFALIFVIWYFSNSWLYISTNDTGAKITIYQDTGRVKEGTGSTMLTALPPGKKYSVMVTKKNGATAQLIATSYGSVTVLSLNSTHAATPSRVLAHSGTSIAASSSRLSYLNLENNHGIETFAANGDHQTIQPLETFDTISWLDPSYGATIYRPHGEGVETDPQIGIISNQTLTTIAPPATLLNVNYSIVPANNKDILLSIKNTIYRKPAGATTFDPIYTTTGNTIVSVLAANSEYVIFEYPPNTEDMVGKVSIIDKNGKKKASVDATEIANPATSASASWSPDKRHIALVFNGIATVYDAALKNPIELPRSDIASSFVWTTNNEGLYASGNTLWRYKENEAAQHAVAIDATDRIISNVAIDNDGAYAYFSAVGEISTDTISRAPIQASNTSIDTTLADKLATVLPHAVTLATCRADYLLFSKPTVIITKLTEENKTTEAENTQWCIDDTKAYLKKQGIDSSSVQFTTILTDSLGRVTNL